MRTTTRHHCLEGAFRYLVAAALLTVSAPVLASVADNGLFELDANAVDDSTSSAPDDWGTPPTSGGAFRFTGILDDPSPMSIFEGGRKDIQLIKDWSHKDGEVPDKDDITDAYAAAYEHNGHLIVYFGADRVSNVGDAYLGFWFFKARVVAEPTGGFSGSHTNGDTLVLVNFPQASNATPYIAVVEWDTTCTRATSSKPVVGDCAAENLRLRSQGTGAGTNVCDPAGNTCAVTNSGDEDAPWPYYPKDGVPSVFPYESFFEGGIDLTAVVGGDTCFSSFMAETRSSSSFTASLKDFKLGAFELCSVKITKTCKASALNTGQTAFVFTYDVKVENDGFGRLYDVTVMDDNGTQGEEQESDDFRITSFSTQFVRDQAETVEVSIESLLNPPTNTVTVTAAGSAGGAATITDTDSEDCAPFDRSPYISVTKDCETGLQVIDGKVVVGVTFSGQVCNDTGGDSGHPALNLLNVTVTDDHASPALVKSIAKLLPGACESYTGSYLPNGTDSFVPEEASFHDTVTAEGYAPLNLGSVSETATANCAICECDDMSCEP